MILRLAAVVSLGLGATVLLLYLTAMGATPWASLEQRHLREMKRRTATPPGTETVAFTAMAALPRHANVAEYSGLERRAVSLEGYVQRMVRAPDGDMHLDVTDSLDADRHLRPYLSAEITPEWHRDSPRWRFEPLLALFRPLWGGPGAWHEPPRRVRLSGWLMYDYPYEDERPVFGFPPHATQWEIHPVTRIEAWDDSLGRFVEFAR